MSAPSVSDSDPVDPPNYFVRHWRGALSLEVSFWVNGFALWLLFFIAIAKLYPPYSSTFYDEMNFLRTVLIVVQYPVAVWQMVGIWRAADRRDRAGRPGLWTSLAKAMVMLILFRLLSGIVLGTYW